MSNKLKAKKPKFSVVKIGDVFRVKSNSDGKFITVDIPDRNIADEICDDFNKMTKRDYTPIGGPDASHTLN